MQRHQRKLNLPSVIHPGSKHRNFFPFTIMEFLQSLLVYLLAALGSCLVVLLHSLIVRKLRRLPPGPLGLPIIGNLLQFGTKPYESLQRLSAKYGDLVCLFLGSKTIIVVSSPAAAKKVYKTYDKECAGRDPMEGIKVFAHNERSIVFGQPHTHWRMLRRISNTELFSPKKLESLRHLRRNQIRLILSEVYRKSKTQACVNIQELMLRSALNLLGKVVLSRDMFPQDSKEFHDFKDTLHMIVLRGLRPNFSDFLPFFRWFDPQGVVRDAHLYMKKIYNIFDKIIEHRLQTRKQRVPEEKDVLDTLLDLRSSDFTLSDIIVYLSDIFIAGTDTTTVTMEWAMAELIRNPKVMRKAQAEIDAAVGQSRLVEETDMEKLPYLQAVVKETFRMHAPVPTLLPHRAEQSCEIEGYIIPKNAQIIINFWAISKDPSIWEDPWTFKPERFLQANMDYRGQNFELIPFGAGRRICAGMPLASVVIHSLLGALVQAFDWSTPSGMSPEDMDMSDEFAIARHKAIALEVLPATRLPCQFYADTIHL